MKGRNIKASLLFLIGSLLLTSCDTQSLGDSISSTVGENLIPNIYTFLAQVAATIILFVCIIFFAYKPAKNFLNKRREILDEEVKITKSNRDLAEKQNNEASANLAKSKKKAIEIIENAKKEAEVEKAEILESANEEAKQKLTDAESIIKKEKELAYKELKTAVIDVALEASSKILEREINENDNQKIIDDFVKEIENK